MPESIKAKLHNNSQYAVSDHTDTDHIKGYCLVQDVHFLRCHPFQFKNLFGVVLEKNYL